MHAYSATVSWQRSGHPFLDKQYPRRHTWSFDGWAVVPGSSSPLTVPVPLSDPTAVDPEEALVAAASSCHMLWFLALAAARGFVVDDYTDAAQGFMGPDSTGEVWMQRIELRPTIRFGGGHPPDPGAGRRAPPSSPPEVLHCQFAQGQDRHLGRTRP